MNSINWPTSSVWVFIAQVVEHCSANAEATGSNPIEVPKNFFFGGYTLEIWPEFHVVKYKFITSLSFETSQCTVGPRLSGLDSLVPFFLEY